MYFFSISFRDRVSCVWQTVRDHLYQLCVHANETCFLVERAVVGLLRLAIRLLRREDISSQVSTNICVSTCVPAILFGHIIIHATFSYCIGAAFIAIIADDEASCIVQS